MMRIISWIFLLLLLSLTAGFALLNSKPVDLDYYLGTLHLPLSLLLFYTLLLGVLLTLLVFAPSYFSRKARCLRFQPKCKQAK